LPKRTSAKLNGAVLSRLKLTPTLRRLRRQDKTIAFTNGCFDLLHVGHLAYLEKLKAKADILIVGVNSDASVRRLKGKARPIVSARERARLVAALKPVDFVVLFSEDTPLKLIQLVVPDLLGKGGDWKPSQIVGSEFVKERGGDVISIPLVKNRSTTRLLKQIERL